MKPNIVARAFTDETFPRAFMRDGQLRLAPTNWRLKALKHLKGPLAKIDWARKRVLHLSSHGASAMPNLY